MNEASKKLLIKKRQINYRFHNKFIKRLAGRFDKLIAIRQSC